MPKKQKIFRTAKVAIIVASVYISLVFSQCLVYAQGAFPGAVPYTVKSGDSLYNIASRNGVSLDVLRAANGITSDLIMPGQVLNIPISTGSIFCRYTIVPGDSLYIISKKFGVPVSNIMYENNLTSNVIIAGEVLVIPYLSQRPLSAILSSKGINLATSRIDVVVDKSEHAMLLFSRGTWLKTYHVEIGSNGLGDKQVQGDKKTPEGTFYICEKSVLTPPDQYLGTRWMRLSYPNAEDAKRGLSAGLINQSTYNSIISAIGAGAIPPQNTALGSGVGIHGGSSPAAGIDWTWGCVGLTNFDVEDLFNYVSIGTRVIIQR